MSIAQVMAMWDATDMEDVREQLKRLGNTYAKHRDAMHAAREAMEPVIARALREGVSPGEVQRLTHLSPATIRTARVAAGVPSAQGKR